MKTPSRVLIRAEVRWGQEETSEVGKMNENRKNKTSARPQQGAYATGQDQAGRVKARRRMHWTLVGIVKTDKSSFEPF